MSIDPNASPKPRLRRYMPVVGPRLKKVLAVVFGLFALLVVNSAYLVGVRILESATGQVYQNWTYMIMFLMHLGSGLALVLPVVVFGVFHFKNGWKRPNRRAVWVGIALYSTALLLIASGIVLTRLEGIVVVKNETVRSVAFWIHVATPVVAAWLFILHRLAGTKIRWHVGRRWAAVAGAFAAVSRASPATASPASTTRRRPRTTATAATCGSSLPSSSPPATSTARASARSTTTSSRAPTRRSPRWSASKTYRPGPGDRRPRARRRLRSAGAPVVDRLVLRPGRQQNGHLDDAIARLESIVALDNAETRERGFDFSQDYRLLVELGQTLFERAEQARGEARLASRDAFLAKAEARFRQALELDPENLAAHYNLHLIAQLTGDDEAAEHHFGRTQTYRPDDNARDRVIAAHRRANPAADHAAEAIVIYDLQRDGAYDLDGATAVADRATDAPARVAAGPRPASPTAAGALDERRSA